ncbi:response regulator [Alkalihalobacillus trypoxylicola]|uniref:LuxR family transcriptional regulator n=1 Tax=Alkalihalobacillus trypoxylicola TaxID=519424 RepID=A0A161PF86_9BACI|nr:response regulator transcription factor [Alkalihalobacillus trypoxylicola]KYG27060.1 LuxR family transcriptional regulator [Alkalihalobacillus trypoxylicola]
MKKILLVEDQMLVRQGLKMMIEYTEENVIIAEAENGKEALLLYESHHVDLVVMDIRMPEMDGLEATRRLKKLDPNVKILILTTFADDEYALEALKLGAVGYLLKDADRYRLLYSIKKAIEGGLALDEQVAAKVVPTLLSQEQKALPKPDNLSERELSIIRLIGNGKNNQEISEELYLSTGTVKNHISQILMKLHLRDRTQIAIFALKHQLTSSDK